MLDVFLTSWDLCLVTLGGLFVNFGPQWLQLTFQVAVAALLNGHRYSMLPPAVDQVFLPKPAGVL